MIQGAVFDVDGTLLDSMDLWDRLGSDYLCSIGCRPEEDLDETFKTLSLYQAACYYRSHYGVKLSVEEIMEGVNRMVEDAYFHKVVLKPGVAELLRQLQEKGVRMCVATATDLYLVEAALERCGVRHFFSEILTCTDVGHGKDEPVIYREALHCLDTEKENTIILEDSFYAANTAKKDGFHVVGIYDVHERKSRELESLSDFYLRDFRELKDFWKFASAL